MSKSALGLLTLAVLCGLIQWSLPDSTSINLPLIASGVFGALFVLALFIGRKIKFDPVLR